MNKNKTLKSLVFLFKKLYFRQFNIYFICLFFLMKLNKGITLVEFSLIIFIFGILVTIAFSVIKNQYITRQVEREMPKTYEYVTSNAKYSNFYTVGTICEKNQGSLSMQMVSDELCYNRVRVFEGCNNGTKSRKLILELENLALSIENEQQADAIINKCENYKQEIPQVVQQESHENDEKINKLLDSF